MNASLSTVTPTVAVVALASAKRIYKVEVDRASFAPTLTSWGAGQKPTGAVLAAILAQAVSAAADAPSVALTTAFEAESVAQTDVAGTSIDEIVVELPVVETKPADQVACDLVLEREATQIASLSPKQRDERLAHIDHYATASHITAARREYLGNLAVRVRELMPQPAVKVPVLKVAPAPKPERVVVNRDLDTPKQDVAPKPAKVKASTEPGMDSPMAMKSGVPNPAGWRLEGTALVFGDYLVVEVAGGWAWKMAGVEEALRLSAKKEPFVRSADAIYNVQCKAKAAKQATA